MLARCDGNIVFTYACFMISDADILGWVTHVRRSIVNKAMLSRSEVDYHIQLVGPVWLPFPSSFPSVQSVRTVVQGLLFSDTHFSSESRDEKIARRYQGDEGSLVDNLITRNLEHLIETSARKVSCDQVVYKRTFIL